MVESAHKVDAVAVDADGTIVASAGEAERALFARSSMKPLQATVSLALSSFEFPPTEVAVMCASHNAEPVHIEAVRSMLARIGLTVRDVVRRPRRRRPAEDRLQRSAAENLIELGERRRCHAQ